MTTYPPPARTVLRMNAWLSIAAGLGLVTIARPLSTALGLARPDVLGWVGLAVLVLGINALIVSLKRGLSRPSVIAFAVVDGLLVAASLSALIFSATDMTIAGRAFVAAAALIVSWFTMAELRAARKL
jgi:hypothetical protein